MRVCTPLCQDHDKSRRNKLADQRQWEEMHLRKETSFDGRGSLDYSRRPSSRLQTVGVGEVSVDDTQ